MTISYKVRKAVVLLSITAFLIKFYKKGIVQRTLL